MIEGRLRGTNTRRTLRVGEGQANGSFIHIWGQVRWCLSVIYSIIPARANPNLIVSDAVTVSPLHLFQKFGAVRGDKHQCIRAVLSEEIVDVCEMFLGLDHAPSHCAALIRTSEMNAENLRLRSGDGK